MRCSQAAGSLGSRNKPSGGPMRLPPASAGRQARPLRSLLPLGRRVGEKRTRAVADRRAARRRPAIRAACGRNRQARARRAFQRRPVTLTSLRAGDPAQSDRAGNRRHDRRRLPRDGARLGGLFVFAPGSFPRLGLKAGVSTPRSTQATSSPTPIFASSTTGCA